MGGGIKRLPGLVLVFFGALAVGVSLLAKAVFQTTLLWLI
ncbi:hypothetical protein FX983_06192 [Pseudomonas frederiksbergensis]|uniref:Uncharacterized protein n=1 Tax=Pseudomonas frederiksbergensis TaxID=104087 RepID=A0A6L5BWD6_9PSED|nr:hypothetical protein FX983_06192 [Pseudomonas frederiksbergensis]